MAEEVNEDWRRAVKRGFFLGKTQKAPDGTATPGALDFLEFDLVESEEHESTTEVTDDPIDTGAVVSDHAFDNPDTLNLQLVVSDYSMRDRGLFPTNDPFASLASRSATAWAILKALKASKEPFDVQTGLELYSNMVITRLSARQDKDSVGWLDVSVSLRQVVITTTEDVRYPPRKAGKTTRQASATKAAGTKKTEEVTEKQKAKTILKHVYDGFVANPEKGLAALGF
jgi:hypothetical protein